jgi:tetratricopeptide (TPR) repeat protein
MSRLHPRASRLVLSCLAFAVVAGCNRKATPPPSGAAASASASAAAAPLASAGGAPSAAASAAAGKPGGASTDEAKKPLTAEERQALARYAAAVGAGRRATRDKRYDEAERAFDRALEQRKDDARALAERGYARLLANNPEGAEEDLERALAGGVEPKLASQAFFNLGLVREKKGEDEPSRAAFAIADALSPSAAAKAKLAGRSACTADVRTDDDDSLAFADDFRALAAVVQPSEDLGSAKASVCIQTHTAMGTPDARDTCDGPPPWELIDHHRPGGAEASPVTGPVDSSTS